LYAPEPAFASVADAVVIGIAIVIDLAVGDPPNRVHPVAWMGRGLALGRKHLCHGGRIRLLIGGALVTLTVAMLAAGAGALVAVAATRLGAAAALVEAAALSLLLSIRGLVRAAQEVARPLTAGDLTTARRAVGCHLVSRPTATLTADVVASATVVSIAENLTDALVAPLFFYVLFGLPGAAFYRAINTADAMIGYRGGSLEYFGKAAARLDDLLNLVPARLAALAIVVAARFTAGDGGGAWRALWRDAARTASPNAGLTMAAMAGALGVALSKPGAYRLGDGRPPGTADVARALRTFAVAAALSVGALLLLDSVALFLLDGRRAAGII
jgi:adenosylcobinamide-phosphate synthase